MFGKRRNTNELEPPPVSSENEQAVEILRVWAAPGGSQELTLRPLWKDPGAWGLLLADIAGHAANAYESEGGNRDVALMRIREALEAEWSNPTDVPKDITPP